MARDLTSVTRIAAATLLAGATLAVAGPASAPLAAASPARSVPRPPAPPWPADRRPGSPASAFLIGVSALSSGDIWAVGSTGSAPAAEHWNGSAWSQVTVPAPQGVTKSYLNAVSGVSADDVWAVGTEFTTAGPQLTLIEHWNGRAWKVVKSPNLGSDLNQLNGVTAVSANDVWAVGNTLMSGVIETQIEQWNGSAWSVVPSPNEKGANANQLNQLSVVSANNIWAVGYWAVLDEQYATLAEHWNGTSWSIVKTPASSSVNYDLQGAAPNSLSASDVWAVGGIYDNSKQKFNSLAEHWNGKSWERVRIPSEPHTYESVLFTASALASNDVWADGWYAVSQGGDEAPLMEHWNGTSWSLVPTPKISNAPYYDLFSLTGISAKDIWAVGSYTPNGTVWYPLFEHWNGTSWKLVGRS